MNAMYKKALEDVIERLWARISNEQYGHAKAAVALDIEAVEAMLHETAFVSEPPEGCAE